MNKRFKVIPPMDASTVTLAIFPRVSGSWRIALLRNMMPTGRTAAELTACREIKGLNLYADAG